MMRGFVRRMVLEYRKQAARLQHEAALKLERRYTGDEQRFPLSGFSHTALTQLAEDCLNFADNAERTERDYLRERRRKDSSVLIADSAINQIFKEPAV